MYLTFFGFREKPFNLTPDPKFLYLNASYREALAALRYGVNERKGFVSLIGDAGTGKTTLLRQLLGELGSDVRSVLVLNPAIGFDELLVFILTDLGRAPAPGTPKLRLLQALNAELLDTLARGGNVVVLMDEAQDLSIPVLEELRLLSNLETAKEKILQFVLAGQPELDAMLARPELRQLRQRVAVPARLRPLARGEVAAYVAARVAAAGGDARGLFTGSALRQLYGFSRGVPRLVNVACDSALVTAYAAGRRLVDRKIMREAMKDLRHGRYQRPMAAVWRTRVATVAIAGTVGALVGLMVSRRAVGPLVLGRVPAAPSPSATRALLAAAPAPRPTAEATPPGELADEDHGAAPVLVAPPFPVPGTLVVSLPVMPTSVVAAPTVDRTAVVEPPRPRALASPRVPPSEGTAGVVDAAGPAPTGGSGDERWIFVQAGDDLSHIARRNYGHVTLPLLEAIQRANPALVDRDRLSIGQAILLPPDPHPASAPMPGGDATTGAAP
ncbi:MAG: AAA family ATPase [Deltaproteobacteria bacterium]|nr:AAA family ATPase [Deltaproteobacteria bacterium]